MRNSTIAIIAAVSVLFAVPSQAAQKGSKEETIGVGSGSLVGAIVGGPVGFIVGAAVGAKIGDSFHKKNERIENLQDTVVSSNDTVGRLEGDVDTLNSEIDRLQNVARPELVSLLQAGIAMDLLFRTDESVLADTTGDRLTQLAGTLAGMSDIHIQLDGFADERGDAAYNQGLSERRAQSVAAYFESRQVRPERLITVGAGEEHPVANNATSDGQALNRRVEITIVPVTG